MILLGVHLQAHNSLKPELRKIVMLIRIYLFFVSQEKNTPTCNLQFPWVTKLINTTVTRKVQRLTSVSKTIRAHTFLRFPSKIVFKLTSTDWLSTAGVTDDLISRK